MSEISQPSREGKIKAAFDTFNTSDLKGIGQNNKFTRVYFATESGNMYRLDQWGRLINRNMSFEKGELSGINQEPQKWADRTISLGKPFQVPGGNSTKVTEIVAVEDSTYGNKEPMDSIIRRFNKGLPRIPELNPLTTVPGQLEYESENL